MKKRNGMPYKTTVKNIWGETIDIFPSVDAARQRYYSSCTSGYLSAMMHNKAKNNTFFDDRLGLYFQREEGGRTRNQKKYRVVYRNGLEEFYNSRKELLSALDVGGRALSQQIKIFGNFKNSEFQIWEI